MLRKPSKTVRVDRAKLAEVLRAGQLMSNICYNLAQTAWAGGGEPERERQREQMKACQVAWDAACRALMDEVK